MTCKAFVELVTDYFDGALSEADAMRFEQHIDECIWCERYLDQMRMTIETVGRIDEAIPPHARDALLDAFREWRRWPPLGRVDDLVREEGESVADRADAH
ncbi:MAG TPA: zf-HC2 domain-containing protein [Thermoleophilaceae bacterium]|nr:zf-HC2 domain-containing protein [Thermoleophilaceae bacterium]